MKFTRAAEPNVRSGYSQIIKLLIELMGNVGLRLNLISFSLADLIQDRSDIQSLRL